MCRTNNNQQVIKLEKIISKSLKLPVSLSKSGGYWFCYSPRIGLNRVSDLLKDRLKEYRNDNSRY